MSLFYLLGSILILGFAYFLFIVAKNETGVTKTIGYAISGLLVVLLPIIAILYRTGAVQIPKFLNP